MTYDYTTTTTANDAVFNAAISGQILNEARAAIVIADKVARFQLVTPGPKSITVPRYQAVTVDALSEGVEQDANAVSTDGVTITSSRYGTLTDLSQESQDQSVGPFSQRLMERMGAALANNLDTVILDLADGFTGNVVNLTGAAMTFAGFQTAIYDLENANAPKHSTQDAMLGLPPTRVDNYFAVLAPVQLLHLAQSIGTSAAAFFGAGPMVAQVINTELVPGFKGVLLGIPVYQSSNVETSASDRLGLMLSPLAIGLALRQLGAIEFDRNIKARSSLMSMTDEFGVAELVDAYAVKIVSKSAA